MTNFEKSAETEKRTLDLSWLPRFRIAVPALTRRTRAKRTERVRTKVARDDLLELFQSDLSGMKSLKSVKTQQNVIQLRQAMMTNRSRMGHAA